MKLKLVYSLIPLLWAISLVCLGQYNPFKGANRIFITTSLADKETYLLVADQLTQAGITFTAADNGLLIRSEQPTSLGKQQAVFEGKLMVNAGLVSLSGWLRRKEEGKNSATSDQVSPVTYDTAKNSLQGIGFNYMDALAKRLQVALHGVTMYKYQKEI
jgi:hypothetical protein